MSSTFHPGGLPAANVYHMTPSSVLPPPPVPAKTVYSHYQRPQIHHQRPQYNASTNAHCVRANSESMIRLPSTTSSRPDITQPPAVPEKPRPKYHLSNQGSSLTRSSARRKEVIMSESMTLPEFVEKHAKNLPLQIKVLRGYCGNSSRLTISADDTYNIHFIKRVKVVHITDIHNQEYSVPINSCVEFGVAYDPKNNGRGSDVAVAGIKLATVGDIIRVEPMPKVICALKAWKGDNEQSSVTANEVFIIKQIHSSQTQKSKSKHKRMLRVYSLTHKMAKTLPEECNGNFTTQPYHNRVLLGDLIEHVAKPFPCCAVMYLNSDIYTNPSTSSLVQDLPETLLSSMVRLLDCVVETSLVSSAVLMEDPTHLDGYTEEDKGKFIDIPLEGGLLMIEVALVNIEHTEKLYDDTRSIYEKFNPSRIKTVRDVVSNRVYSTQTFFYSAVRRGCENLGVELDEPSSIYDRFHPRVPPKPATMQPPPSSNTYNSQTLPSSLRPLPKPRDLQDQTQHTETVESIQNPVVLQTESEYDMIGNSRQKFDDSAIGGSETDSCYDEVENVLREKATGSSCNSAENSSGQSFNTAGRSDKILSEYEAKLQGYENRLGFLESQVRTNKGIQMVAMKDTEKIKSLVDQLSNKVKSLEAQLQQTGVSQSTQRKPQIKETSIPPPLKQSGSGDESVCETNKAYLKKLTISNIMSLLDMMELSQYKDLFVREQISGEILLELDESVLRDDLTISSKLHRIRLLKVISGKHSAYNLLSGINPYEL